MRTYVVIEVFDPKTGKPILRVRWAFVARLIVKLFGWLDYAEENDGWGVSSKT